MSIRLRPVLAVAVCAALAAGSGIAAAAPKPVCNLVTDAKGDAGAATAASDPVLDILSGDVATNAKKITAVIRVPKLAAASNNYPTGVVWRMNFTIGDTKYAMSAISDRSGVVGQVSYTDPTTNSGTIAGGATVVLDMAENEVRVSSTTTGFATRVNIKRGMEISALNAVTGGILQSTSPVGTFNLRYATVDTAQGDESYAAGTKSCVSIGK